MPVLLVAIALLGAGHGCPTDVAVLTHLFTAGSAGRPRGILVEPTLEPAWALHSFRAPGLDILPRPRLDIDATPSPVTSVLVSLGGAIQPSVERLTSSLCLAMAWRGGTLRLPPRSTAPGSKSRAPGRKGGVILPWPVEGRVTSHFGWRWHPLLEKKHFHKGLDIEAELGTTIAAVAPGVVSYVGWSGPAGKVVTLRHDDGMRSSYAHCSSLLVQMGQRVSGGQAIARVGASGRATGAHLHFAVLKAGLAVDPLPLLR